MIWLPITLAAILLLLLAFHRFWFCRKPMRRIPGTPNIIVSPATGRLVAVKRYNTERTQVKKWNKGSVEFLSQDVAPSGWLLVIVMTPLDVHFQRAPTEGKVLRVEHHPGTFRNAVLGDTFRATLQNEHAEILMENEFGKIKVVQIAGLLARRIRTDCKAGDELKRGEVIGFINIGSQVALVVPDGVDIKARVGDNVIDGETVLGVYP